MTSNAPKKRNRAKKPAWSYSGISAAEWRLTPDLVKWAQDSPQFRSIVTLLVNDRATILEALPIMGATENRLLGRHEAYEAVRTHLLKLAEGAGPEAQPLGTADYSADNAEPTTTVNSDFVGDID